MLSIFFFVILILNITNIKSKALPRLSFLLYNFSLDEQNCNLDISMLNLRETNYVLVWTGLADSACLTGLIVKVCWKGPLFEPV